MKIGIDLKPFFSGSKFRGIGMYTRELIKEMIENDYDAEYHFLNFYDEYIGDPEMNEKCYLHNYYSGKKVVDVGEKRLLDDNVTEKIIKKQVEHFIKKNNINVMLFTSSNEFGNIYKAEWFKDVYTVGILYDLIPMIFPEQCLFLPEFKQDYEKSIEFIKKLDLLLAISESAKSDAVRLLGIDEKRIVVIHAGISNEFKKLEKVEIKKLKDKYNIKDPFILFAGGIDFKKNIDGLIEAYSMLDNLWKKKYQLVITGKTSEDTKQHYLDVAEKFNVKERIVCTGYVPDKDLVELYNTTELLVFPSFYEGFGLPVVEAMACGARVLTSNNSSLVEIAKGYATLVDPTSPKKITKGIQQILENPIETLELAEKSIDYAKTFTWKDVAQKTLNAIDKNISFKNKEEYEELKITENMLEDISLVFAKNRIDLEKKEIKKISNLLFKLQNGEVLDIIKRKNRILYDMTVVHEWLKNNYSTGIGRVCKELFFALKEKNIVIPVFVSGKTDEKVEFELISMENYSKTGQKVILQENDIFFMPEFQIRGVQIAKDHPYIKILKDKGHKCYAVIYDILPLQFPQFFESKTATEFGNYVDEIFKNYSGILTDSKAVADEVIEYYEKKYNEKINKYLKIGYFHLGQDTFEEKNEVVGYELSQFMNTEDNIYLMVGTIEPRKGHSIVFETFEKMWKSRFTGKLCIIGHVGWKMGEFINKIKAHKEFGKKLLFIEGATDSEVSYAYKNSSALIQASAGEGFGLPLIEAGYYNLPIICSDIPVFHEISYENAIFFNRNSIEDLEGKIEFFEENKGTNKIPKSKNIKSVTWNEVGEKVSSMIVEDKNWYLNLV